ncbi:MAG: biopolymer transporter ExbD [bacterium]
MAFKKLFIENRKVPMVSLIDLIFILLLFFITTSVMINLSKGEARLNIPTPINEPGEAQILIQIIDKDHYFWLDYTAIDTLHYYSYMLPDPNDPAAKIQLLLDKMTISKDELVARLKNLFEFSKKFRNKEHFILIRCPNVYPFYYATNIIEYLIDNPFFEYGCVPGDIEDILASKKVTIDGNILQIDL